MDRRTFLASAVAATAMPFPVSSGGITETYASVPAGFALRSWHGDDGRVYRNEVVRLPRYSPDGGNVCLWTEQMQQREQS